MKTRVRKLSPVLKEILVFFARDCDLPEIVGKTGTAYRTLERRVERLRDLLGARHPQGLIAKAHKRKLINLDEI